MTPLMVNGAGFAIREWGCGPPLLLLHGFTGSAATWTPHAGTFGRHFRTIAVDLLGHGDSDAPTDPARYRVERCVEDLAALLDTLGIARTACLGYSMGGRIALAFALAHPQRLTALLLESASPGIADPTQRALRAARDAELATRIEREGITRFVDEWTAQPLFATQAARLSPALRAAARAARLANRPRGLANSLRGAGVGRQAPFWHRLHELAIPTLLLVGADDATFRGIATAMAGQLPEATLRVVPRAGHTTHLENPRAFRHTVLAFLRAAAARSRSAAGEAREHAARHPHPAALTRGTPARRPALP